MDLIQWKFQYDKLGKEIQEMIDEATLAEIKADISKKEFEISMRNFLEKIEKTCTARDFYEKYKFISDGAVHSIIKKHPNYFDGFTELKSGRLFFNEERIIQFYLENMNASRMNRERMIFYSQTIPALDAHIKKLQNKKED